MQKRRNESGRRPRVGVSLDEEDYDWIESLNAPSASLSYKLSRVVKAARLAGITIDDAKSPGVLHEFRDFLKTKKRSKLAGEMRTLIDEFLDQK